MTVDTFLSGVGFSKPGIDQSVFSASPTDLFLAHHGIKGQRWGVRRFQNKDGTLTAAGRKRLAKLEEKKAKLEEETNRLSPKKKTPNPHGKKSVFDMSDEELNKEINRLGLEKKYKDYMKELYPSKKKQPLIDGRKMFGEIAQQSLTNVGKNVAENLLGVGVNRLGKSMGLDYDLYTKNSNKKKKKKKREDDDDDDDD